MKKILSIILLLLMIIQISAFSASASKTVDTPEKLIEAIENAGENETIYLEGGYFRFENTQIFSEIKKNITIKSSDGEKAVITSAVPVENWQECKINGIDALCAKADGRRISALFSEEKQLQAARFPETGFLNLDKPDHSDTVGEGADLGSCGFFISDIDYELSNPEDIAVEIVHSWVSELAPMTSFSPESGLVKMGKYSGRPIEEGDRYFLENVIESLDKAGEWCYSSADDMIYYVPQSGETAENLKLFASSEAELFSFESCSGITFENIGFADTGWNYGNEKYLNTNIHIRKRYWETASFQAAVEACGAITVTNSDNINFTNCEFRNIGCTAIKYFTGAKHCRVENCLFDGVGASAVFAGGKFLFFVEEENNPELYAEDITVKNCEIRNYGLRFFGACGITVAYCDTADISNNEIHDGYYTGISVGFTWLFFDNPTQKISVKDNLIYNIGHHMISDLGGIYLLGVQQGTVVSGNVIHDVTCYDGADGYAGNGIYLDSGCEFMTIENNLVFNCDTSGFNTTLSRNNLIQNNIFAFSGECDASLGLEAYTEMYPDLNSTFKNNIFLTDNKVVAVEYLKNDKHFTGNGNIIWDNTYGDELYFCINHRDAKAIIRQTAEKKKLIDSCVFADPGFTDAGAYDFTFRADSFAVANGFVPFDYSEAGTIPDSVIGFDTVGGNTAYNADVKLTDFNESKLVFGEAFKAFFYRLFDIILSIFR